MNRDAPRLAELHRRRGRALALWAMNMAAVYKRARAADELARSLDQPELTVAIGGMLAQCLASEGSIAAALEKYAEVRSLGVEPHVARYDPESTRGNTAGSSARRAPGASVYWP